VTVYNLLPLPKILPDNLPIDYNISARKLSVGLFVSATSSAIIVVIMLVIAVLMISSLSNVPDWAIVVVTCSQS